MALYAYPSSRSTAPPLFPSSLPSNHSATAAHLSLSFLLHLLPASSLLARSSSKQPLHFFHSIAVFSNIPLASSTTAWFPTSTPLDSSPCLSLFLLVIFQFPSLAPASFVLLLRHGATFECQPPGRHRSVAFFFFSSSPRGLICRNGMTHRDASKKEKKKKKKKKRATLAPLISAAFCRKRDRKLSKKILVPVLYIRIWDRDWTGRKRLKGESRRSKPLLLPPLVEQQK